MMLSECAKLANYANAMVGRNEASDMQVIAWHAVLNDVDLESAMAAVATHMQGPRRHEFFTVSMIVDGINAAARMEPHQIEGDVRSARTRGLIDPSWPTSRPLPGDVARELARRRQDELDAQLAILGGPGPSRPFLPGVIGKEIPRA